MSPSSKRRRWSDLKSRLETFDRAGLVGLVADLYEANPANRRFLAGTVDLMLSFVEAGTAWSLDLGYGEDSYFSALESKLNAIAKLFDDLPARAAAATISRLRRLRRKAKDIGWGYGDFLDDVVTDLERRMK